MNLYDIDNTYMLNKQEKYIRFDQSPWHANQTL